MKYLFQIAAMAMIFVGGFMDGLNALIAMTAAIAFAVLAVSEDKP